MAEWEVGRVQMDPVPWAVVIGLGGWGVGIC